MKKRLIRIESLRSLYILVKLMNMHSVHANILYMYGSICNLVVRVNKLRKLAAGNIQI